MPDLNSQNTQEPKPQMPTLTNEPAEKVAPIVSQEASETPTSEATQEPKPTSSQEVATDEDGENLPLTRNEGQSHNEPVAPVEPQAPIQPSQTPTPEPMKPVTPVTENNQMASTPTVAEVPDKRNVAEETEGKIGFWARLFGKKPKPTDIEKHVDLVKKDPAGATILEEKIAASSETINPVTPPVEPVEQGQQQKQ